MKPSESSNHRIIETITANGNDDDDDDDGN
jgi:hypothetical protein